MADTAGQHRAGRPATRASPRGRGASILERTGPEVEVISLEPGPGSLHRARANNLAARRAQGRLLLFVSDAIEVPESEWIRQLALLATMPRAGPVGPLHRSPRRPGRAGRRGDRPRRSGGPGDGGSGARRATGTTARSAARGRCRR